MVYLRYLPENITGSAQTRRKLPVSTVATGRSPPQLIIPQSGIITGPACRIDLRSCQSQAMQRFDQGKIQGLT